MQNAVAMKNLALLAVVVLAASGWAAGCTPSVVNDNDDDHDPIPTPGECDAPPPPASGWCPPSWACLDGEWVDTAGACPDPCPVDRPWDGDPCDAIGAQCSYDEPMWDCTGEEEGTSTVTLQCTEQGWSTVGYRCMPEPICPDAVPVSGGDCSDWMEAYFCSYQVETSCGQQSAWAECWWEEGDQWLWHVELSEPCDSCEGIADAGTCAANSACRWLEPGCDEPAVSAGCYPADDCTEGSCGDGQTCTTASYDPCWNAACDACGAEALLCL